MQQRSQPHSTLYDEVIRSSLHVDYTAADEGRIYRLDRQDSCAEILKQNQELLDAGGSRTTSFGKVELCIPEIMLRKLKRKYPELDSADRETKVRAWKKFLGTSESRPFRVSRSRYG
jgi:hypothetical protein